MRIVIDLDGTICPIKQPNEDYANLEPLPNAVERIRALRAEGHYIIIQTARHMKTCEGNVGLAVKKIGKLTLEWLERHGIEYDEIYFGKPNADVYIDDRALRFESWDKISSELLQSIAKER
ncbi:MAG: 5' nucleotidase, NT5C type [Candidatus Thermochlorobacter sp.]